MPVIANQDRRAGAGEQSGKQMSPGADLAKLRSRQRPTKWLGHTNRPPPICIISVSLSISPLIKPLSGIPTRAELSAIKPGPSSDLVTPFIWGISKRRQERWQENRKGGADTEGRKENPGKHLCNTATLLSRHSFPVSCWEAVHDKGKPGPSRRTEPRPQSCGQPPCNGTHVKDPHRLFAPQPRGAHTPSSRHGLWRKDCPRVRSKQLGHERRPAGLTSPSFSGSPSLCPCPYFFSACVGSDFGPAYAVNTRRPDGSPRNASSPLRPIVFLHSWDRKNSRQLVSTTGLHEGPASSPTFYSRDQVNMHNLALQ